MKFIFGKKTGINIPSFLLLILHHCLILTLSR